jgi:hypothetical protein
MAFRVDSDYRILEDRLPVLFAFRELRVLLMQGVRALPKFSSFGLA